MTGLLYPFIKAEKRYMRRNLRFSYVFTLFDAMILILLVNNFKKTICVSHSTVVLL